jgi:MFS family permease
MTRARSNRALMLACFLVSGFTALCYQTVWMRLAIARFGVNASVVASVLAVFMLGLAVGSFGAGRLLGMFERRFGFTPLRVYALAELLIAIGGVSVPFLFDLARRLLLALGPASGLAYSAVSGVALTMILLPFCAAMGLTFPSAIAFLRRVGASGDRRDPFGALYLVNVLGALIGTIVTSAVLIELLGFLATSRLAAAGNAAIALAAMVASRTPIPAETPPAVETPRRSVTDPDSRARRAALFTTGFITMGLEVVWMRIYPSVIGTIVYAFAVIIGSYLLATTGGSIAYRLLRRHGLDGRLGWVWPWLVAASVVPFFSASTTLGMVHPVVRVFVGLFAVLRPAGARDGRSWWTARQATIRRAPAAPTESTSWVPLGSDRRGVRAASDVREQGRDGRSRGCRSRSSPWRSR